MISSSSSFTVAICDKGSCNGDDEAEAAGGGEMERAFSCELSMGGIGCVHPRVLPAWQRLRAGALAEGPWPTTMDAAALSLRASEGGGWASADALRARAKALRDAPMLEVTAADLSAAVIPVEEMRRFRCGAPVAVVSEPQLDSIERGRLDELRGACPAYFAKRGASSRDGLDMLHQRRRMLGDEPACAGFAKGETRFKFAKVV